MKLALKQQRIRPFLVPSGIGVDFMLYQNFVRLFVLCVFIYIEFLSILLLYSKEYIIFVRLLFVGIVFALFYMQFDKRKLSGGLYKLRRLLYFTRAVGLPPSTER